MPGVVKVELTGTNLVISFPHAPSAQLRIQTPVSRPSVEKAPWPFAVTVTAKWVFISVPRHYSYSDNDCSLQNPRSKIPGRGHSSNFFPRSSPTEEKGSWIDHIEY